ncbi:hypothetical protein Scep_013499 [Stephania cephalantha]|uniref:HMA domain-containing protein n=1 Tax=Stephania cephalantha TaxID=152367 RepID=A0AAP0JH74_9MAGN
MGEETKEEKKEEAKEENKKEEGEQNKEEKEEEAPPEEIVLRVDMHCEACARKVIRALKGFQGVEDVKTDCKSHKVIVKGKTADPLKVCERVQRKSGRKVEIISPLPKPSEEEKKEEEKKEEKKEEEKKDEPPPVITVILKMYMHCEACAQLLRKRIRKIAGVESVETDVVTNQVIVKGVLDPTTLVESVYKKTKRQALIVRNEEKPEEKKEEEEEKKKEEVKEEEKKEGEDGEDDKKIEAKKSEYWPSMYAIEYAYPPQIFSDENPNAYCSVM